MSSVPWGRSDRESDLAAGIGNTSGFYIYDSDV